MWLSEERQLTLLNLATVMLFSVENFCQQYVTNHFLIFSLSQEPHNKSAQGN